MWTQRLRRWSPLLSLALFGLAVSVLYRVLYKHGLADVMAQLHTLSPRQFAEAGVLTLISYVVLSGYDLLALRHLGHRLPLLRVMFGAFVSYVFVHNLGLSLLTGGSVRYRIYGPAGLSAADIATITTLCALTFGLGAVMLGGIAFLTQPIDVLSVLSMPPPLVRATGCILLAVVFAYVAWTATRKRAIRIGGWSVAAPDLALSLKQLALAAVDIGIAGLALYVLLPASADIDFTVFLGPFVLAITAGALSHVPGGLGVIEAVVILMLPSVPADALFASLLAYRVVYYLVPLVVAALLLAGYELAQQQEWFVAGGRNDGSRDRGRR
jgi:phosphatidylglycerol lysyltransferase